VQAAEQLVGRMPQEADANSFYRFLGVIESRLLLAQGDKAAARNMLTTSLARATEAGWGYAAMALRALQAPAAETEEDALEILAQALEISRPEGFIRTYVDAGVELIPLLRESARRGTHPNYVGQLLRAFDRKVKPASPLAEPLSHRELEVMRLVAAGLSNREIAEALFISTGTVKTHVHNICGKLGARNRLEATTKAKELAIL
jgi:LuxR family maltose regulon positive regulatory protein